MFSSPPSPTFSNDDAISHAFSNMALSDSSSSQSSRYSDTDDEREERDVENDSSADEMDSGNDVDISIVNDENVEKDTEEEEYEEEVEEEDEEDEDERKRRERRERREKREMIRGICDPITPYPEEKYVWPLIKNYISKYLVRNQTESFNWFLTHGLQYIIDTEPDIVVHPSEGVTYKVAFNNIYALRPKMMDEKRTLIDVYPSDARKLDINYEGVICCDIEETYITPEQNISTTHNRIPIAKIPMMVGSYGCNLTQANRERKGECPHDRGGYFVINGIDKVLITQLKAKYNHICVERPKIKAKTPKQKQNTKKVNKKTKKTYLYVANMRSMSEETDHSVVVQCMITPDEGYYDNSLYFTIPYIKDPILAGIVFKAMGFSEEEMVCLCGLAGYRNEKIRRLIRKMVDDSKKIPDVKSSTPLTIQDRALLFIGESAKKPIAKDRRKNYVEQILEREIFPHLGVTSTRLERGYMLGKMVNRVVSTYLGLRKVDNKDDISYKRFHTAGLLCYNLFKTLYKKWTDDIRTSLAKKKNIPDIKSLIAKNINISKGLSYCFSTGHWGVQRNSYIIPGVCQPLSRMTYAATISELTRIIVPTGCQAKNVKMRQIDSSEFGFLDPNETPEGGKCGLVLNHSIGVKTSLKHLTAHIRQKIERIPLLLKLEDVKLEECNRYSEVCLNDINIGFCEDATYLVNTLKELRKTSYIPRDVTIFYDQHHDEVHIYCDEGRFLRALFTLNDDKTCIKLREEVEAEEEEKEIDEEEEEEIENCINFEFDKWDEVEKKGMIEFVHSSEIEQSTIAMYPPHISLYNHCDYCEIHPIMIMGYVGAAIPWSDHSQAPRNVYQCSMGKQALGIPVLTYQQRTDTMTYVMNELQRPLVTTKVADYLGLNEMPSGLNVVVAVMNCMGLNM